MSEAGIAIASLAFEILSAGISQASQGDVKVNGPSGDIGAVVQADKRPDWLRRGTKSLRQEIFRYRSETLVGIEAVNVKLVADVQYNGLECQCNFYLPSDGQRSRLNTDTTITIGNPQSLMEQEAPQAWKDKGYHAYPVVFVPINIFVDEPWPNDNVKVSGKLVLSGMYGFGASGYDLWTEYQETRD